MFSDLELTLAEIAAYQKAERQVNGRKDVTKTVVSESNNNESDTNTFSDNETEEGANANFGSARAHTRRREPVFSPSETNGPKCYFCSICGFNCEDELGIHSHQEQVHPEVPLSDLLRFFCVDKSLREKRVKPKVVEEPVKKGRGRPKGSGKNKISQHQHSPKKLSKIERKKEKKLFKKRRHIPRIWERERGMPLTDEFLLAIGLVRKDDVLLGERKRQSVISSKLLRNGRRELSPAPTMHKSARIVMKRIPIKNNKVFLCDHCSYYATSKTEVRRHRRNEHLKNLRQPQDTDTDTEKNSKSSKSKQDDASSSKTKSSKNSKKHKKSNGTLPESSVPIPSSSSRAEVAHNSSSASTLNSNPSSSSSMKRFNCKTCDFFGFSRTELEAHESKSHKSLNVQISELSQQLINRLLKKPKPNEDNQDNSSSSSSSSSVSSSRASSPPRKKTKVRTN